jgi:hypothetical protein
MPDVTSAEWRAKVAAYTAVLNAVWRAMAPDRPMQAFLEGVGAYHNDYVASMNPTPQEESAIGPEEANAHPDNSAMYETYSYQYRGLDAVQAMLADRSPIMFAAWHHGAIHHVCYGVVRTFPQTAVFTRWRYQYGRVSSFPMQGPGALALVRMDRFLREARPIFAFVDGPPFGKVVQLPIFGVRCNFSLGPIHIVRGVERAHIVPVTHCIRDGNTVDITFHPSFPEHGRLPEMSESDVIGSLLGLFEREQRRNAPTQVLPEFLLHRQEIVRAASSGPRPNPR